MSVLDLSCKTENPPVEPEARVEVKVEASNEFDFVRIPVTMVEMWVNKDGPADMNRTAKVKFPSEWTIDGEARDISSFINGFSQFQAGDGAKTGDPYDEVRIYLYDEDLEEYVLSHYGYAGGVGPANDEGVMKMWVYDAADLMKSIQVSKSWGQPTLGQVTQFAINGVDDQGKPVGIQKRSIFNNVSTYIAGEQRIPERKQQDIREALITKEEDEEFAITGSLPIVGSFRIPVGDLIEDFTQALFSFFEDLLQGQKQFRLNRHNMVDHMNWFTNLIDARWWFEPSPDGPILFIDATGYVKGKRGDDAEQNTYARRIFASEEFQEARTSGVGEEDGGGNFEGVAATDETVFAVVDILENDALYDIKPFNTMYVYGESATSSQRNPQTYSAAHSTGAHTEKFPYVKVTYPPLLDRADGNEYAAPAKETDDLTAEQARATAVKEFRKHLAENTEGEIIIKGEPHIMPYDYVEAIPVCRDIYANVDVQPIRYEVNEVHHKRASGEHYTTELGVSLSFDESLLDITAKLRDA